MHSIITLVLCTIQLFIVHGQLIPTRIASVSHRLCSRGRSRASNSPRLNGPSFSLTDNVADSTLSQTFAGISVGREVDGFIMTRLSKKGFGRLYGRKVSNCGERDDSKCATSRENAPGEDCSSIIRTIHWKFTIVETQYNVVNVACQQPFLGYSRMLH